DEQQLERSGHHVENAHPDDELYRACRPLDDTAQATRPPLEMKAQREAVQMLEGAVVELTHRMLTHSREEDIPDLVQHEHEDAGSAVCNNQSPRYEPCSLR